MEAQYNKITQELLEKRIEELLKDEKLQELEIKKIQIGITNYNYPINMIQIGNGEKEIFIVSGTHSSEIIGMDFSTQLIKELPNIENYDPNEITLNIIPIQNPEGFNVVEQTYSKIEEKELEKVSLEYYYRYKIDYIIVEIIKEINKIKRDNYFIENLKQTIKKSSSWKRLTKIIPNIKLLKENILQTNNEIELLFALKKTIDKLNPKEKRDIYLNHFINILITGIEKNIDITQIPKLYQKMFEEVKIENLNIKSKKMKEKIVQAYKLHPKGSQIGHDSTGTFINLNGNHLLSPGIEIIREKKIKYMSGTKSNIRNYIEGPNGIPCIDIDNFEYSIENQILYKLIKESNKKNKYLATLLYHGTGGIIYYLPHQELMDNSYHEFLQYNTELTEIYNEGIQKYGSNPYKLITESETTGYGDLLARTFKGVLLIELSKMGGNPIGPYGDKENINKTINENISAINNILKYFKKINNKTKNLT